MKRFPFYHQPDAMDCGPACLKMIAACYGRTIPLENLRSLTHISKRGVSLFAISEAAEQTGFRTTGGRISFEKLCGEVMLPCIAHWDQEHFVVVYRIRKKNVFRKHEKICIADPAFGLISYNAVEFKTHWLSTRTGEEDRGIVLLLEPGPHFFSGGKETSNEKGFRFLFSYFLRYRKFFVQLFMGLVLGSLFQLVFPFLTQAIVDTGIAGRDIGFIFLVLIAQAMLVISRMSVEFIRRWILLHISTRINLSLISDFFIKMMKLPMNWFDTRHTGDILQRINDHQRIENFLTVRTLETLFSFITLIIFSVVLWIYSLKIFAVFFAGSLVYTLWILIFLRKRRELDFRYFDALSDNQNKTLQLVQGMQEIKLQGCEKRRRWEWEDVQACLFRLNTDALKLEQVQEAGNIFINEGRNVAITIIAALAVINNEMTLGMMLATQYIIGQLTQPVDQSVRFVHDLQDAKISLERINEIHRKEDENEGKCPEHINLQSKSIHVSNLAFCYEGPGSAKVLNGISLTIPEGKITAIVGASGSGKTTLIKLLLQYYKPIDGKISVGSTALETIHTGWWRSHCGVVMQDGFIFSDSIAHNIAAADDEPDKDRLSIAAKIAGIHEFIMELPLKYNTVIGNEGQNLSQGQKQRILIARAVYRNPDYLFLDEATNALDARNEKAIVENLQEFYKGKTVVIIAHRLSTVKGADQIIVMDEGKIAETGNHRELTAKKGVYYCLVKNQLELGI